MCESGGFSLMGVLVGIGITVACLVGVWIILKMLETWNGR